TPNAAMISRRKVTRGVSVALPRRKSAACFWPSAGRQRIGNGDGELFAGFGESGSRQQRLFSNLLHESRFQTASHDDDEQKGIEKTANNADLRYFHAARR